MLQTNNLVGLGVNPDLRYPLNMTKGENVSDEWILGYEGVKDNNRSW